MPGNFVADPFCDDDAGFLDARLRAAPPDDLAGEVATLVLATAAGGDEGVLTYFYQGLALKPQMAGKVHARLKG